MLLLLLCGRVLHLFDCFAYNCVHAMYACDALISEKFWWGAASWSSWSSATASSCGSWMLYDQGTYDSSIYIQRQGFSIRVFHPCLGWPCWLVVVLYLRDASNFSICKSRCSWRDRLAKLDGHPHMRIHHSESVVTPWIPSSMDRTMSVDTRQHEGSDVVSECLQAV